LTLSQRKGYDEKLKQGDTRPGSVTGTGKIIEGGDRSDLSQRLPERNKWGRRVPVRQRGRKLF